MFSKYHLLYIFVTFTFLETIKASESSTFCYNSSLEGFRLKANVYMSKIVVDKIDCIVECAINQCCRSLNYKKNSTSQNETSCEMSHNVVNYSTFDKMLEKNASYDYVYLINPEKKYNNSCISKDLEDNLKVPNGSNFTSCNFARLIKKGCYKDQAKNRTFPTLLKTYPWKVNWNESWHEYLYNVTCYCAKQAKNGGHRFFGVQHFEECWAGELAPEFFETRAKAKEEKACWGVRPNHTECIDHTTTKCVGSGWHNYIYEIIPDSGLP